MLHHPRSRFNVRAITGVLGDLLTLALAAQASTPPEVRAWTATRLSCCRRQILGPNSKDGVHGGVRLLVERMPVRI